MARRTVRVLTDNGVIWWTARQARHAIREGTARVVSHRPFILRAVELIQRGGCLLYGDREHREHRIELLSQLAWARRHVQGIVVSEVWREVQRLRREAVTRQNDHYEYEVEALAERMRRARRSL